MKYGMEGYGLYWYCLELIAQNVEKHNLSFELEHDSEIIAHDTGIHYELVQDMVGDMVDLGLFERSEGIITCLKMASRTDEYTQKLIRAVDGGDTRSSNPVRIYFIGNYDDDTLKVGVSANPWARIKDLQTGHPSELSVLATATAPIQSEAHIALALKNKHVRGEWYKFDDDMRAIVAKINVTKSPSCDDVLNIIASVVGTYDGATPDIIPPIRTEQNRTEQNRTEQNRTEKNRTEKNRTEKNRTEKNRTRFAPPSLPDVLEYKLKRQSPVDPNQFIDYYESNGWKVGKNKMTCWKACFRNWEKREGKQNVQYQTANEKAAERMRHTFDADTAAEF